MNEDEMRKSYQKSVATSIVGMALSVGAFIGFIALIMLVIG